MLINCEAKPDKFEELILYVSSLSETDPRFGSTKLNKLLFYADFAAYRTIGKSISNATYQKLEHGPCPRAMLPVQEVLIAQGALVVKTTVIGVGRTQKKPIALRQPNLSVFSPEEIDLVNRVVKKYWNHSTQKIRDKSHEFPGWRAASLGETIPYDTALVRSFDEDEELPDCVYDTAATLKRRARELLASHAR